MSTTTTPEQNDRRTPPATKPGMAADGGAPPVVADVLARRDADRAGRSTRERTEPGTP